MKEISSIPKKSSPVLVTGAAGGLGVHVVRALSAAGWEVRAFDRVRPEDVGRASLVADLSGVSWTFSDDSEALRPLLAGSKAIVHLAGLVTLSAEEDELMRANLDLSRDVFEWATAEGVEQFIHISCAFVYQSEQGVRIEDSPTSAYNAFERSKLAAERTLYRLANADEGAPALTVLRPGMLYGPGCKEMGAAMVTLPAILRGVSRYLPGLSGGPRTNWCHVADAASAILVCLDNPAENARVFNVADDTALSFGEALTSIIAGYGIDLGPSLPMPSVALWALLIPIIDNDWAFDRTRAVLRFLWNRVQTEHKLDSPLRPRLNRNALFYVRDDAIVVADALRELGWEPAFPDFRKGISETIRWYQDEGWVPRFDLDGIVERRDADSTIRLQYRERLRGRFKSAEGDEDFDLDLQISWPSLPWPPVSREGHIEGNLTVANLAENTPIEGTITLRWLPSLVMEYEFGFLNDQGIACRFHGTRQFQSHAPVNSLREVTGKIIDSHAEVLGDVGALSS